MPDPESAPPLGSAAWLEALLRARLGPGAVLGELAFAGKLLVLRGARVPIGAASVVVERAEIELGRGLSLAPLPLSARLVSLRAAVTLPAGGVVTMALDLADGEAPAWFAGAVSVTLRGGGLPALDVALDLELDVALAGPLEAPALRGVLRAPRGVVRRGSSGTCVLEDVSMAIDLDRRRLRYQDLRASAHGARLTGWGRVPLAPPAPEAEAVPLAAMALLGGGVGLLAALASLAGIPVRAARDAATTLGFHVPADLAFAGELLLRRDGAATGALSVSTPRTELTLRLALGADGDLVGSTLRGHLAAADAITLGLLPGPVRPRPPAVLAVDGRLGGTLRKPSLSGRAGSPRFELDLSADPAHPALLLEDVAALLDVSGDRLGWHDLTGRFYGGTLSSSGAVGFGDAGGLHAAVGFRGVRVELIPTQAAGESRLAGLLHGAASGEVKVDRHGFGAAPLFARGAVRVVEPRYFVLRALAEPLGRYGLPGLPVRGEGPLRAEVRLEHGEVHVEHLEAAVEGVELGGAARVGASGALEGRVVVNLLSAYLAQSPLLALPAAFAGRVVVPVELSGTVQAPDVRLDALEILEGMLVENRVGEALKGVLDGLRGLGRRPRGGRGRRSRRR
jgi:hypothetical protein